MCPILTRLSILGKGYEEAYPVLASYHSFVFFLCCFVVPQNIHTKPHSSSPGPVTGIVAALIFMLEIAHFFVFVIGHGNISA